MNVQMLLLACALVACTPKDPERKAFEDCLYLTGAKTGEGILACRDAAWPRHVPPGKKIEGK